MRIIPCIEWGARAPAHAISRTGRRPDKVIEHHTAGHVPNMSAGETLEEAKAYARVIQQFHMGSERGWSDSGHNFLITRGGFILEGRHGSIAACEAGEMVVSAHCPGQNHNPGIEHEHNGTEALPKALRDASVWLNIWLCERGGINPRNLVPHGDFFPTDCPSPIVRAWLPELRNLVRLGIGKAGEFQPLKQGDSGDRVLELQRLLDKLPYVKLDADGDYGKLTVTAVKQLQKRQKLPVTGECDEATWKTLHSISTGQP